MSTINVIQQVSEVLKGRECFRGGNGVLCLGDARELIKSIPDEAVDHVITDPPWGVGFDEFDDGNVMYEIEDELWRVLKRDAWFVFYYTPKYILKVSEMKRFEYVWMIPYIFWSFGSISRNPLGSQAGYSIVVVMRKGKPKIKMGRRDIIVSDELPITEGNIREPQFKPTYTVAVLLSIFTKEGDVILDPFSGYGSIPLVCELFGRRWIAFEIDPIKYRVSVELLKQKKVMDIVKLKKALSK